MRGDKKQAIALYTQAIKYYEQSGDWGRVAVVNHNIGALYSNMEDQKSAIEHTLLACAGYRRVKNFKSLNTGLLNLIFYYKETDSLEQANRYVSEVEQSTYPLNPAQKALFWILKGHIAEKKKNFPLAIELLDSCIAQAKLANSPINLHNGQATLARIQLTQKQYAPALKNALSALDIALEMNDATSINLDQKFVAKAYEGLGNTAEAVRFYSAYEQGRDTLYTQETFQAVRNIEEKYETEKKERMIQAQRAEIAEQRFGLGAAIFMVLSLMVAVIWLYTSRKIRQQKLVAEQMANQLLQEQKDQLQMANTELQESLAKAAEHAILTQEVSDMVINLSNRDKTQLRLGDILYIESKGNFVHLHTANERLIDWQMINHYETLLAPSNLFMRTHRSFLVNRLHVSGRRATEITISNGHKVTIASTPSTKAAVHSWLDQWVQEG
jgi:tetratricopeptide (TPR) repeat protein